MGQEKRFGVEVAPDGDRVRVRVNDGGRVLERRIEDNSAVMVCYRIDGGGLGWDAC